MRNPDDIARPAAPGTSGAKLRRQAAIRRLLRERRVATQEDLSDLLAGQGIEATQATLSRDLAQLGALRVSTPEGAVYELEALQAQSTPQLRELAESILSFAENEALAVLRTRPGLASAVALAIDNARLPECLGTLAGDDTIFATPARGVGTRRLSQRIRTLFGRDVP